MIFPLRYINIEKITSIYNAYIFKAIVVGTKKSELYLSYTFYQDEVTFFDALS